MPIIPQWQPLTATELTEVTETCPLRIDHGNIALSPAVMKAKISAGKIPVTRKVTYPSHRLIIRPGSVVQAVSLGLSGYDKELHASPFWVNTISPEATCCAHDPSYVRQDRLGVPKLIMCIQSECLALSRRRCGPAAGRSDVTILRYMVQDGSRLVDYGNMDRSCMEAGWKVDTVGKRMLVPSINPDRKRLVLRFLHPTADHCCFDHVLVVSISARAETILASCDQSLAPRLVCG